MYDMTKIKKRYFELKLPNGKFLLVEPPKLKVLRKLLSLAKVKDENSLDQEEIENLNEALALALSKNKQNYKISPDQIEDLFDINESMDLLNEYFGWVNDEAKN